MKFRLGDASGAPLADPDAGAMVATCLVEVTLDGAVKGCAIYVPRSDMFQFDLKTSKNLSPGPHTVGIRVSAAGDVVNETSLPVVVKT